MEQFPVEYLLYFYLYVCAALLLYNVLYILGGWFRSGRQEKRADRWNKEIGWQLFPLKHQANPGRQHQRLLEHRLRRVNQMIAYSAALEEREREEPEKVRDYLDRFSVSFQNLATWYGKRDSMERAYFAWFTARFRPCRPEQRVYRQILTGYLENATVYCRENVLQALYALGEADAVESAFQFMNDRGIFHHGKLLADGLLRFSGDREALAGRLWVHRGDWNTALTTAVVQFITAFSANFQEEFLETLENASTDRELRMALLRYFRRYLYEPAREQLSRLAGEKEGSDLAIVASFVLDRYPGEKTEAVLRKALCSRNWYVRANAAVSLLHLGAGEKTLRALENGGDRYAREMLEYQRQRQEAARKPGAAN